MGCRTYLRAFLIICAALIFSSCHLPPPRPQRSQLELRELQTRYYPGKNTKVAMKGIINALQDEGFLVKTADRELGFLSASKEVDISNRALGNLSIFLGGHNSSFPKNSIVDASANVTETNDGVKVRVIFQRKVIDNHGNPLETEQLEDPGFYQDFFSKVDKSLFIERQGI